MTYSLLYSPLYGVEIVVGIVAPFFDRPCVPRKSDTETYSIVYIRQIQLISSKIRDQEHQEISFHQSC